MCADHPSRSSLAAHWTLDPDVVFLNHGSFGATTRVVLDYQETLRRQMEREPVRFFVRELEPLLDAARAELAGFVGASTEDLAFVTNATAGVNAVLRSLDLDKHDELLTTNHEYSASRNALEYVCALSGAKPVIVDLPFPISGAGEVVERVLAAVTERTRLMLIDHVTSPTGLVMPVETLVSELARRGIDTLIDGAHAPGMLPLDLTALGVAYYTANLHKWVCGPKGAAFLYVRKNRRASIRPTSISHGASSTRTDRSRFHQEFDWTGTVDPSAWLAAAESLRYVPSLVEGGWPEVMRRNHALVLTARDILCSVLGIDPPAPDAMLGSMAAVPLPPGQTAAVSFLTGDPLQEALFRRFAIEVPVNPWPAFPQRVLRVSAQLYNTLEEYAYLAEALRELV
jgi:isopenicillin-N epimerase